MSLCLTVILILVIVGLLLTVIAWELGAVWFLVLGVVLLSLGAYCLMGAIVLYGIDVIFDTSYFSWQNAFWMGLIIWVLSLIFSPPSPGD